MEPQKRTHSIRYLFVLCFLAFFVYSAKEVGQSTPYQQPLPEPVEAAPIPVEPEPAPVQEHLDTPTTVRGVYLTEWSAGNEKTVERIINLVNTTELNAVIIDIKDATGKLSYLPEDPALLASGVGSTRIRDLRALTAMLHEHGIYVIGRVQVFQDPFFGAAHPEYTYTDTRTNTPWRDHKGILWLRADSQAVWDYVVAIGTDAYAHGVDEINVDYVRYPSDGSLQYIGGRGNASERTQTVASFFEYISTKFHDAGIILSADIFGLTMSAADDLGIGQKVEVIAPYVDYICPMVYPSHFAFGSYGIALPAEHPYEVIHTSLSNGLDKLSALNMDAAKLRPWLQDFNLGAVYTEALVRAQITAAEELGINSWMLWDPRNQYTATALDPEPSVSVEQ